MMSLRRCLGQYGHPSKRTVLPSARGIQECSCSTSSSTERRPLRSLVPPRSRGNDHEGTSLMVNFLFKKDQPVKVRTTGEVGTVEYFSTDPTTDVPFYRVRFADGTARLIAENELSPA